LGGRTLKEEIAMIVRPDHDEAADYYYTYIDQVGEGDIRDVLERQSSETTSLLRTIDDQQSSQRYAPDKWSIREVVGHINDTERLFVFRALWFARECEGALPSFDQNVAVPTAAANERSWSSHVDEFKQVRAATVAFFSNLPTSAWSRRGVASGYEFTVRALAFITAGHAAHHVKILRERYL
jgi:hypothetical protein